MIRQPHRWYVTNDTQGYVVSVCDTAQEANREMWRWSEMSPNRFSVKEI